MSGRLLLNNTEGKWLRTHMILSFLGPSVKDAKDCIFEDITIITVEIIKPVASKTEMNLSFLAAKLGGQQ